VIRNEKIQLVVDVKGICKIYNQALVFVVINSLFDFSFLDNLCQFAEPLGSK